MGGSFDPVHVAHVTLATAALQHLALDEVRWVPVGQAWQKARPLTPAEHRLAMLQAATAHEPRFVIDPIEVNRPGPSYTLDTVRALQANVRDNAQPAAQWFLIIGQDQLANLPTWHGWQTLLSLVTLAVACRGAQSPQVPDAVRTVPHQWVQVPLSPLDTSSTDIRARLARGDDPRSLSPRLISSGVADYIANHQLYAPGVPR